MSARNDIYKCPDCGATFETLAGCDCEGGCEIKCCDETMELLEANTVDAAVEKHVPVVEKTEAGCKVKVGSVPHPMTEEHLIEWIEVIAGNRVCRVYLSPGDAPEAEFSACGCAGGCGCGKPAVKVREYCNLHGLWEVEL
jgi:superoxide reductase